MYYEILVKLIKLWVGDIFVLVGFFLFCQIIYLVIIQAKHS